MTEIPYTAPRNSNSPVLCYRLRISPGEAYRIGLYIAKSQLSPIFSL